MKSGLKGRLRAGALREKLVATYAAMKSGLKDDTNLYLHQRQHVATYAAMKSGLKGGNAELAVLHSMVATYAAMKSGLKDRSQFVFRAISERSNLCPDEKGTERWRENNLVVELGLSST